LEVADAANSGLALHEVCEIRQVMSIATTAQSAMVGREATV
jgi:hypothetical protein